MLLSFCRLKRIRQRSLLTISGVIWSLYPLARPQSTSGPIPKVVIGSTTACIKSVSSMKKAMNCKSSSPSAEESSLISNAQADLNKVLASPEFQQAVLAAHFTETNDKTNEEIYKLIASSSPVHLDIVLFKGGLKVNKWDHTQGFEDDSAPNVVFGNTYFIGNRRGFLASLMLHEAMHVLGFHHYDEPVTTSIPYTMNTIYDGVAQKLGLATSFANAE